jgi:ribosome-associated protein
MIRINETLAFTEREVEERFVRASGPGGQNINKDATAVELRVDIRRSSLPPDLKERLIALAGRHVTADGVLVVASRAFRSQAENRKAARARLVALLKRAARAPKQRTPTKPRAFAREERLASKKARAAIKATRSLSKTSQSER